MIQERERSPAPGADRLGRRERDRHPRGRRRETRDRPRESSRRRESTLDAAARRARRGAETNFDDGAARLRRDVGLDVERERRSRAGRGASARRPAGAFARVAARERTTRHRSDSPKRTRASTQATLEHRGVRTRATRRALRVDGRATRNARTPSATADQAEAERDGVPTRRCARRPTWPRAPRPAPKRSRARSTSSRAPAAAPSSATSTASSAPSSTSSRSTRVGSAPSNRPPARRSGAMVVDGRDRRARPSRPCAERAAPALILPVAEGDVAARDDAAGTAWRCVALVRARSHGARRT